MNQGTTIFEFSFDGTAWPPDRRHEVFSGPQNGGLVEFWALPSGSFVVEVQSLGGIVLRRFESAPIRFTGKGATLAIFSWDADGEKLLFSGQCIPPIRESMNTVIVPLKDRKAGAETAVAHPDANTSCAAWMLWRADRFSVAQKNPSSPLQRTKSFHEQLAELSNAAQSVEDLLGLIANGRSNAVDVLATSLRALVYWDSGRKYQPLLLRIAARCATGLPLPVFAEPTVVEIRPIPRQDFVFRSVSSKRLRGTQRLMDLQEWLESPVRREWGPDAHPVLTAKDLIVRFASEAGSGHYSEQLFMPLDAVLSTFAFERSVIEDFIVDAAGVVLDLSRYVLANAPRST